MRRNQREHQSQEEAEGVRRGREEAGGVKGEGGAGGGGVTAGEIYRRLLSELSYDGKHSKNPECLLEGSVRPPDLRTWGGGDQS